MFADKTSKRNTHVITERPPFERAALILQGGGALGVYQTMSPTRSCSSPARAATR